MEDGADAVRQIGSLETTLHNALVRLNANPPGPLELLTAQRRLLARLDAQTETDEGLAQALGYADITGGDMPETLRQHIAQTTPADIRQFVTRYLLSQPGVTLTLLPDTNTADAADTKAAAAAAVTRTAPTGTAAGTAAMKGAADGP